MPFRHCIRAALAVLTALAPLSVAAQQTPEPAADPAAPTGEAQFVVFLRSRMIGTEEIAVTRDANGWRIISSGRLTAPLNIINRRLDIQYDRDWKPLQMTLDATVRGQSQSIRTTMSGTTAASQIVLDGKPGSSTTTSTAEIFLPSPFFGAFEALAARLSTATPGTTLGALAPPETEINIVVGDSAGERIQTAKEIIDARHTRVTITPRVIGASTVEAEIWGDETGRLLRVSIPDQGLEVLREDIASVSSRRVPISRPNDEQVRIAANGFTMVGTLSKPTAPAAAPLPAVLLVGGSGPTDRDELVFGVPIFGQLADTLADAGFIVLRYDKRGVGQSGGRPEAATLTDFSNDVRAAVKFLDDRRDVDSKRISVLGYGEGGAIAMLAAARDRRIASLVLVSAIGTTGAELNMEQARRAAARSNKSEADKQATLERQQKIQEAVLTGAGWTDDLVAYRGQADTPWFESFLAYDPARVMRDIRQPIFVLQGELDGQIPPDHADRLGTLANQRKNRPATQVVKVAGVNHLLVAATTGEIEEYTSLKDKRVNDTVSAPIVAWLQSIRPES
jgi:pimeloyl-ACP methyl ester carboxylesterase